MKKKVFLAFVFLISLFLAISLNVSADMGPKPATHITFENVQKDFYVSLISKKRVVLHHHPTKEEDGEYYDRYVDELSDIEKKFFFYENEEGYLYYGNCEKVSKEKNRYDWTYHSPEEFKILIYYEDTDSFVLSDDVYTRYAFSSYFTVKLADDGTIESVRQSYQFSNEIINCIVRIILTILVELGIALLFGYRKKVLVLITITNVITQIFLNVSINLIYVFGGALSAILFFFLIEFFIFIIEGVIYAIAFKKIDKKNSVGISMLYAFVANLASLFFGFLVFRSML